MFTSTTFLYLKIDQNLRLLRNWSWLLFVREFLRPDLTNLIASSSDFPEQRRQAQAKVGARPNPPLQCTTELQPFLRWFSTTSLTMRINSISSSGIQLSTTGKWKVFTPFFLHYQNQFAISNYSISQLSTRDTRVLIWQQFAILSMSLWRSLCQEPVSACFCFLPGAKVIPNLAGDSPHLQSMKSIIIGWVSEVLSLFIPILQWFLQIKLIYIGQTMNN